MGPLLYMWSVVDWNIIMRHIPYSSLPHLIKYAATQIKEQKHKTNNIFIYFYWLYTQWMAVTTDAAQFTTSLHCPEDDNIWAAEVWVQLLFWEFCNFKVPL